ncbi:MAG: hypothetical protein NUW01_05065, partial [Gemmatimonadaceae bacterium]|nr:hypothetical protein [Gemmatimonadaceae bacterium]
MSRVRILIQLVGTFIDAEDREALFVLVARWLVIGIGLIWAAYAAGTAVRVFCETSAKCAGG